MNSKLAAAEAKERAEALADLLGLKTEVQLDALREEAPRKSEVEASTTPGTPIIPSNKPRR